MKQGWALWVVLGFAVIVCPVSSALDFDQLVEQLANNKQRIKVPLESDGTALGEIEIELLGEKLVTVELLTLVEYLPLNRQSRQVILEHFDTDSKLNNKRLFIKPSALALFDIVVNFNPKTLSVQVEIPIARLTIQTIQARSRSIESGRVAVSPGHLSFFTNFRYGLTDAEPNPMIRPDTGTVRSTDIESGFGFSDWLLEGRFTYNSGLSNQQHSGWRRDDVRLTRDFPADKLRLILGDLYYPVQGLQGFNDMLGIGLSKNDGLDPYRVTTPTGSESFSLNEPSTVEVMVNDRIVRTLFLNRGNYRIQDLPGVTGINDVRLRIRNQLGQTSDISYSFVFNHRLLTEGEHDYSYNVGLQRDSGSRHPRYKDQVIMSLYHRYGISSSISAGYNIQLTRQQHLLGLQGQYTSSLGAIAFDFADARRDGPFFSRVGLNTQEPNFIGDAVNYQAYRFQYRYEKYRLGSFNLTWQHFDEGFSVPSNSNNMTARYPIEQQILASYNRAVNRRFAMGLTHRLSKTRNDIRERKTWELSAAARVFSYLRLNFRLTHTSELNNSSNLEGVLTLAWQKPNASSYYDFRYESDTERYLANYVARASSGSHRIYSNVSHREVLSSGNQRSSIQMQYDQSRLTSSFTQENLRSAQVSEPVRRFSLGTALVMADNVWSISQPITNGFAIVKTDLPLKKGQSIGVNPLSSGGFSSHITPRLPAVTANLSPYYFNRIYLDAVDTDYEFDDSLQDYHVVTSYKAGKLISLEHRGQVSFSALLVDQYDRPLPLLAGILTHVESQQTVLFFTNRQGELFLSNLDVGPYSLQLFQKSHPSQGIDILADPEKELQTIQLNVQEN